MFKLKNFKRKLLQSNSEKRSFISNEDRSLSRNEVQLDQNQVELLREWLDRLNSAKLITITDQDDIVIRAGDESDLNQQIFINRDDIQNYMKRKRFDPQTNEDEGLITMSDLARILLIFDYVNESSGQLSFAAHTIALDTNELKWLRSIVHHAQPDPKSSQTHVKLFDGENTEILSIPYEYLLPTNDTNQLAQYLFQNGHIRYDVQTKTYAYRYIQPDLLLDEKRNSPERISQRQLLSFHIRDIHVDRKNKSVQLHFLHEDNEDLILPIRWYDQLFHHHFNRDYIIDILLANGGVINGNIFVFMGRTYSLREPQTNSTSTYFKTVNLSLKEKSDLIREYIHLIIEIDAVKFDQTNQLLVIENDADGRRLYFTPEHSLFIKRNQFRREDVIEILIKYSQIKQDQYDKWICIYNNQSIRLPSSILSSHIRSSSSDQRFPPRIEQIFSSNNEKDFAKRYDNIIDYMCRHGLVTWEKSSNLIKLHFADQTLLLPIHHLRSMINPHSTNNANLPFTSRQLSQWLRNNSYITRQNVTTLSHSTSMQ